MPAILREYQHETLNSITSQWAKGYYSTFCVLFTGAGKTVIFIEYCKRFVDYTKERALIILPAHLVTKTERRFLFDYPEFSEYVTVNGFMKYPNIGVEMDARTATNARLVIGSSQTVIDRESEEELPIQRSDFEVLSNGGIKKSETSKRRVLVSSRVDAMLEYGLFDTVIYDEAHHSVATGSFDVITRIWQICDLLGKPRCKLIGFSATGYREDGIALGNLYQTIAIQRSSKWGEQHGYLVPPLDPIRVIAQIPNGRENALEVSDWTNVVITAWKEKASERLTLAYLSSVAASKKLTNDFISKGIPAAHIDGELCIDETGGIRSTDYREEIYDKFMLGKIRVICNYNVLLEGVDLPPASCIVWGRETENIGLTTQALGRVLRPFAGNEHLPPKENCLIIDVTGNDMTVMTAGTLAGFRIDPTTGKYISEAQDDEMETEVVYDGRDLRDVNKGYVISSGVLYSVGKLIRKTGSDWHQDERTGVITLPISTDDTLVVVPPHYTLSNHLVREQAKLQAQIEAGDQSKELSIKYNLLEKAILLFSNFTLWHHKRGKPAPEDWSYISDSLDRLMDFAIPYMSETANPVSAFVSRTKTWKDSRMSEKQKTFLTNLCEKHKIKFDPNWTQGDAFHMIGQITAFNESIRSRVGQIYKSVATFIK